MYRYDEFDHRLLAERIAQFRRVVARRLRGELSEDQIKPLRLMNGVYLQLHAYMLRINVPYGCLSSRQLRKLADISRRHDRGFGHFTTRHNMQFHWISLAEVPDILTELASVEMNTIQSSGNCVRNISADHYAGRARDEIEDPRPWCELIRQWSILHPEFSYLPRKFKIAVSGGDVDRAAVKLHDVGLYLRRNAQGEVGFEVVVGGGQGRTPLIAQTIREWLPKKDILSYLEAILRVYNLGGRRDNIHRARIKIQVNALGADEFRRRVEEEWAQNRDDPHLEVPAAEWARIQAHFAAPAWEALADNPPALAVARARHPDFDAWYRTNVVAHRASGYAIANITLKAPGVTPGDITAEQMELIAELADRFSFGEVRVNHRQNLTFTDVRQQDLHALWQALVSAGLATANHGLLTDIVACPGLDFCALANARSIPLAESIGRHFADAGRLADIGELTLNISGCMNACGHHHVGNIGILGVEKNGREYYQITLGGCSKEDASLGERLGPGLPGEQIPAAIEAIIDTYIGARQPGEAFLVTCRRIGTEPFKQAVYGAATEHERRKAVA